MTNPSRTVPPAAQTTTWFAGASGLNMRGATFNNVQGDMNVNNANRTTKNVNSNNKTKEVTKNVTNNESRDQHLILNQNVTAGAGARGAQSSGARRRWDYVLEAHKGPPAPRRSNIKRPMLAIEAANTMGNALSLLEGGSGTRRRGDGDLVPVPGIHAGRRQAGHRVSGFDDLSPPPKPQYRSRGPGSGSTPKREAGIRDVPRAKATYNIVKGDVNLRGHDLTVTNGKPDKGRIKENGRFVDLAGQRVQDWSDNEKDDDEKDDDHSDSHSDSDPSTMSSSPENTDSDSKEEAPPKSLKAKPKPSSVPPSPMAHLAPTSLGDIRRSAATAAPRANPGDEADKDVDDQVPSPVNEGSSRPILSGLNDLMAQSSLSSLKEDRLPSPEKKSKGKKFYGTLRSKFRKMDLDSK